MFGIELLSPPAAIVLAGLFSCEAKPPPRIKVTVSAGSIVYDLSKSSGGLQGFDIDTVSPYQAGEHTKIGGLTGGEINISTDIGISLTKNMLLNKGCVWLSDVMIRIKSDPTVYIASEYKPGSCRYRTTVEHEMKHVTVDTKILNEFAPHIEAAAKNAVADINVIGPVKLNQIEKIKVDINKKIEEALKSPIETLHEQRRERQQAIDTREEYDRLSRLCGDEF